MGGARQRMLITLAGVTMHGLLTEICGHSFRPMITKQGIEYSKLQQRKAIAAGKPDPGTVGLGALSAAVSNLSSLLGIVGPIAWAWLYSKFGGAGGVARRVGGKGGHWFIAAAIMMLASGTLASAPKDEMYLDVPDDSEGALDDDPPKSHSTISHDSAELN